MTLMVMKKQVAEKGKEYRKSTRLHSSHKGEASMPS